MRYDDPNRTERLKALNPRSKRELGPDSRGSAAADGFRTIARAPRVHGMEPMRPEKAKRIEEVYGVGDRGDPDGSDHGY